MTKTRWLVLAAIPVLVSGALVTTAFTGAHAAATGGPASAAAAPAGFTPGVPMEQTSGALPARSGTANQVESENWSGYAVSGSDGAFHSVSASWTEPTATCSGGGDQYAAFWVGLDGYSSSSVEQTGTDSDCSGGAPDYYGWYEMYPSNPVYFSNPVSPGDSMSASVTVSGTGTYTLVLTDSTQGWTQTETENESGLADSSAEVITEAPSSSSGVLPLADFNTVNYASATVNGSSMDSQSPIQIVMVGSSGDQLDSTSAMNSASDFSNTWEASS